MTEDQDIADNELRSLTQRRGLVKAKLTRFRSFLQSLSDTTDTTQLKLRLTKLQNVWDEFEDIQTKIDLLNSCEEQEEERELFESSYFELAAQAENFIKKKTITDSSNIIPSRIPSIPTLQVKLPPIDLPSFNGDYDEWISFSETFVALIHTNNELSDIQKFHYLRSSLKKEAAHVIQALDLCAANYSVAWSLLEQRYKNKKVIVLKHIRALFSLPKQERDSSSSLRHLLDDVLKHLRALKALEQPTESWDQLVLYLVTSKLTSSMQREWELHTDPDRLSTFNELTDFLQRRCQLLEGAKANLPLSKPSSSFQKPAQAPKKSFIVQHTNCRLCNGKHAVFQCQDFLKLSISDRYQRLKEAGICYNCLQPGHRTNQCHSRGCRSCGLRHNTVLHKRDTGEPAVSGASSSKATVVTTHSASQNKDSTVLLSTAMVDVISPSGKVVKCRALLDNGSQASFMTENTVQSLGLRRTRDNHEVSGLSETSIRMNGTTSATIKSCVSNFRANTTFIIVPKITGPLPTEAVNIEHFSIPNNIALADPNFSIPGRVDVLIGQELFWELLCIGQVKTHGLPTLQKTRLGWVVGGRIGQCTNAEATNVACHLTTTERISAQLEDFWAIEQPTSKKQFTSEEIKCEEDFQKHTIREEDGHYNVRMPLKRDADQLGNSREIAERRFLHMERKLSRDQSIQKQYTEFMKEYEQLGHMSVINGEDNSKPEYFLPHHPVLKTSSTTTKLRVVFDASAKTTSGLSLNDIQLIGPTVQSDLFSIILRFRLKSFVMCADLEKMYRQINIHSSQRDLLKIMWREHPSQDIQIYKLNTVTYGTASAAYLATRVLKQLSEDEKYDFPDASAVAAKDFYVDDLMTAVDTVEEGLHLQNQLISLLSRGGFNLRKWNSNSEELLQQLDPSLCERNQQEFPKEEESTVKTLGLWWDAKADTFRFKHTPLERKRPHQLTKRVLLSEIARLFDPLGLVAPIIVRAKMQLQELWKLQLGWDEALPMNLHNQWFQFLKCLNALNEVVVSRQCTLPTPGGEYELHGFSDASERAYGGAVYLRHTDSEGGVNVSLLCAKSRVAPVKVVSLPRLELCAALLLAELMNHVRDALPFKPSQSYYWTDSSVVLAWISKEPARWTTFVANRVTKIQDFTSGGIWRHVRTEHNPADLTSRGARTDTLSSSSLWWSGPSWLCEPKCNWPTSTTSISDVDDETLPERRTLKLKTFLTTQSSNDTFENLISRFSSFTKLIRITALCLRFISKLRGNPSQTGPLTPKENIEARNHLLKYVQQVGFAEELKELKRMEQSRARATTKGSLMALSPFMDEAGLVRVGGRLDKSALEYDGKHQIILPKTHKVTEMIAREEHVRQLHCGPQSLLYAIRQNYWPINGRSLTRKITHQCIKCFRAKPKEMQQLMGSLPASRANPARAFALTGLDYCGPFYIKPSRRRGVKPAKAYVTVFVCLATKAVHLELVSDLSTETFLGALRRFVARRGICSEIFSDNGKTFVGANRQLQELRDFFQKEESFIVNAASERGIKWNFIPPYAPHMGGLWEAAVKSFKHHLYRITTTASLTYEEFNTILTQVEAVLNSRPLSPMSNDPLDLNVLTPGHFLTGSSLTAVPEPSLLQLREGHLSRWQRVQQLMQHFWSRWSREYLNNLQQRSKWKTPQPSLHIGTLVIIKDDNLPPLAWRLGRVILLHPGRDGLVRVVTLKTASGEVKRSINKLCILPMQD